MKTLYGIYFSSLKVKKKKKDQKPTLAALDENGAATLITIITSGAKNVKFGLGWYQRNKKAMLLSKKG